MHPHCSHRCSCEWDCCASQWRCCRPCDTTWQSLVDFLAVLILMAIIAAAWAQLR